MADPVEVDLSEYEDEDRVVILEDTIRKLHQRLQKLENRRREVSQAIYSAISECVPLLGESSLPPPTPPKDRRRKNEEVAVAWFSDWQLAKVTSTYDSQVCAERVGRYVDKVIAITDLQRADHPVKKCHLWLTGDMVEGEDIFPSQTHLIDSSVFRQVFRAASLLADAIERLAGHFEEVVVEAVDGNHGWIGGGPRRGKNPETNMDRLTYHLAAEQVRMRGLDNVRFRIPDPVNERSWYLVSTIGNYSCLLIHGDQIKGQLGFPWYGFGKKVNGWANGAVPEEFQDVAAGHWHQAASFPINFITVRVSGSTESDNQYAQENLAAAGRASQWLLFVHPERGEVTAEYRVWLDEPGMQDVPVASGPWDLA